MDKIIMDKDEIEQLAQMQHDIWSHWMQYMFTCGVHLPDGSWAMPPQSVVRWQRQAQTTYNDLSESEKESDRDIVRRFYGQ
jgi:hypothetical protein